MVINHLLTGMILQAGGRLKGDLKVTLRSPLSPPLRVPSHEGVGPGLQISHTTLSLIRSLVFAIGWTGRCCLYPLVSRGNCRWLGTVSFTTNLCCLQPKAQQTSLLGSSSAHPLPSSLADFCLFYLQGCCALCGNITAPTIASALRLEGTNCLAAEPPLYLHLVRQCTHRRLCGANIQLANDCISRACGTVLR